MTNNIGGIIMNKNIIQGKWTEVKGKLKQQWADLTDDDITKINGSFDELVGRLQQKYGYQQDEAEREIDAFMKRNNWE